MSSLSINKPNDNQLALPLPLFPMTTVGSWPRSEALLRATRQRQQDRITAEEYRRKCDAAVLAFLAIQEKVGLDIVSDGEQRRDNFYSFVAEKLNGVKLMSLAEMFEIVEDKAGFEQILQSLDVPAYSITNPTCVGKISRKASLALEEYRFLRGQTKRAIKVTLPGPYLLTRAMWVKEVTQRVYATKEDLAEDVVAILLGEVKDLRAAGVDFIQIDEPVLTELVFTQGRTRTFMCAALAARNDPTEELEFAVSLINRVAQGMAGMRSGIHICRGNWSREEKTLLTGSYQPLAAYLARLEVQQYVLEYATPRAGELGALFGSGGIGVSHELGLGVVNPRTAEIERAEQIIARVTEALNYLPAEKIFLNPDCGFGTFASRPMNTPEIATQKLSVMVEAALKLREIEAGGQASS